MTRPARLVMTGGGTGGHVFPAVALMEAIQQQALPIEVVGYVGHPEKLEADWAQYCGVVFYPIRFSGMPRRLSLTWFMWFGQLIKAFLRARQILKTLQPDGVMGTGGYVTAPVMLAANTLGIPFMAHEPDAYPGLVNRLISRWASVISVAFEQAKPRLKAKHMVKTGNPLRTQLGQYTKAQALQQLDWDWPEDVPVILVMGGSGGARHINTAVVGALPALLEQTQAVVMHQTGKDLYEETKAMLPEALMQESRYRLEPFIDDMSLMLAIADIVICRAGSMTLSELALTGKPAILIPYPYAAANHQWHNAQAMVQAGAAVMILDAELTPDRLMHEVVSLLANPVRLTKMAQAMRHQAQPDATEAVVSLLKDMLMNSSNR